MTRVAVIIESSGVVDSSATSTMRPDSRRLPQSAVVK